MFETLDPSVAAVIADDLPRELARHHQEQHEAELETRGRSALGFQWAPTGDAIPGVRGVWQRRGQADLPGDFPPQYAAAARDAHDAEQVAGRALEKAQRDVEQWIAQQGPSPQVEAFERERRCLEPQNAYRAVAARSRVAFVQLGYALTEWDAAVAKLAALPGQRQAEDSRHRAELAKIDAEQQKAEQWLQQIGRGVQTRILKDAPPERWPRM